MRPLVKKYDQSAEYYFKEGCYIAELSNSEDDPTLSIARARVTPGVTTNLHKLSDTIERYVIIEGEGMLELGSEFKKELKKFDTVVIPANMPQKITNTGNEDLLFLVMCSPRFEIKCYQEI